MPTLVVSNSIHRSDYYHYYANLSGRRGLRRGSTAARLLGLWVRIPPVAWISVCVECCVLCVVRYRSLRRADRSSREVLPTVMRRCVLSRNLKNEEVIDRVGPQHHRKKMIFIIITAFSFHWCWDGLVSTVARLRTGQYGVRILARDKIFSSPRLRNQLWGPSQPPI